MKRLLLSTFFVGCGLFIVMVSALSVGRSQGFASSEDETGLVGVEATGAAKLMIDGESLSGRSEYYLPYPGMLPDHPLYFLKMFRDKVRLWTSTQEEKEELLLLYADKRIGAAEVLIIGGKPTVGVGVALKAEGYLLQAMEKQEDKEMLERVYKSAVKHGEIIDGLVERLVGDDLSTLERAQKINQQVISGIRNKVGDEGLEGQVEQMDKESEGVLESEGFVGM